MVDDPRSKLHRQCRAPRRVRIVSGIAVLSVRLSVRIPTGSSRQVSSPELENAQVLCLPPYLGGLGFGAGLRRLPMHLWSLSGCQSLIISPATSAQHAARSA